MNNLFFATLYGTLAGVLGTAIGGILSAILLFFGRKLKTKHNIDKNLVYSLLYEFSSGLMMAVVTFHMLPEAIDCGGLLYTLTGLFIGLLFVYIFKRFISKNSKSIRAINTGMVLLFGIALHNFPEGIAIGTSFANNISLAMSLLFIITIHDIPEGISVFVPLYQGGMKLWKILVLTAVSGLPTGLGAMFGHAIGNISIGFNSLSLAFAAGAMLYICVGELSFEAKELYNRKIIAVGYILGLVIGIMLN